VAPYQVLVALVQTTAHHQREESELTTRFDAASLFPATSRQFSCHSFWAVCWKGDENEIIKSAVDVVVWKAIAD
jgi:hypothetical protein